MMNSTSSRLFDCSQSGEWLWQHCRMDKVWLATIFGIVLTIIFAHSTFAQDQASYSYVVQPGDYWGAIAELTGVPVAELQAANPQAHRRSGGLLSGEVLTIPVRPLSAPQLHIVQPGESWNSIADDYGVLVKLLQAVNPRQVRPADELYVGVTLLIPNPPKLDELTYAFPLVDVGTMPTATVTTLLSTSMTLTNIAAFSMTLDNALATNLTSTNFALTSNFMANNAACQARSTFIQNRTRAGQFQNPKPLKMAGVEVTQSIQPKNRKYIVDRSTAILVTLAPEAPLTETLSVTGCIHLFANGLYSETITALATVALSNTNVTLVFEAFAPAYIEDLDLDIEILDANDPLHKIYTVDGRGGNYHFTLDSVEPLLYYVPVDFEPGPPLDPAIIAPGRGDAFLKAVLPVSDQQDWQYQAAVGQTLYLTDVISNGVIACEGLGSEGQTIINTLMDMRHALAITYTAALSTSTGITDPISSMMHIILYGWVADPTSANIVPCYGLSNKDYNVAFGTTMPTVGQRTYAHEVFHIVRNDNTHKADLEPITQRGWDVDNHLPGDWQLMDLQQNKPTNATYALMTGAQSSPTAKTWILADDYNKALSYVCAVDLLELTAHYQKCPPGNNIGGNACISKSNYVMRGAFNPSGSALQREYTKVSQLPWYSQPTYTYFNQRNRTMPFAMLFFQGEQLLAEIPFDAEVHVERSFAEIAPGTPRYGLFDLVVEPELVDRADRILIRNREGQLLPYLERSSNEPTITILDPLPPITEDVAVRAALTNSVTIRAGDVDGVTDPTLTCYFSYSPNQGSTWLPLQVRPLGSASVYASRITVPCGDAATNTYIIANRDQLPPSRDGGLLRAFVSDGFHVQYADVEVRVDSVPIVLFR